MNDTNDALVDKSSWELSRVRLGTPASVRLAYKSLLSKIALLLVLSLPSRGHFNMKVCLREASTGRVDEKWRDRSRFERLSGSTTLFL